MGDLKLPNPNRRVLLELNPFVYAYGNTKAENLLPELPEGDVKVRGLCLMHVQSVWSMVNHINFI